MMEILLTQWSLFLGITLAIAVIFTLFQTKSRSTLPPGPRALPIVGNLFMLGDNPHRSLAHLANTYGPLITLKLGHVTTIVASSPDMAREILYKKDREFCARSVPDAARALGHHTTSLAWQPANKPWRKLRKIFGTQLFSPQKLDDKRVLRLEKARELTRYVEQHCETEKAMDIGRAAFTTALNLISRTLFSVDMVDPMMPGSSSQGFRDLMWKILEESGRPNLSDFFPVMAVLDLQGTRRRVAALFKQIHAVFDELIDLRLRGSTGNDDFLDWLIKCQGQEDGLELHGNPLKTTLADVFVGGSDTSSNTVEWAMAELLRNPSSMTKARSELIDTIGDDNELEESIILQLPYLRAVVKETLRLHPPVPFLLPRRAETDVELCGYVVPQGTRVLVNVWAMGRDAQVWDDPDVFMPERFLDKEIDFRGAYFELIPFGAGRRICPGLSLAFRMVHLMLASLLHSFQWNLPDGMGPMDVDMTEKFGITLAKATPLQAIPKLAR